MQRASKQVMRAVCIDTETPLLHEKHPSCCSAQLITVCVLYVRCSMHIAQAFIDHRKFMHQQQHNLSEVM